MFIYANFDVTRYYLSINSCIINMRFKKIFAILIWELSKLIGNFRAYCSGADFIRTDYCFFISEAPVIQLPSNLPSSN